MRALDEIIDQMLGVIPDDVTDLRADLNHIKGKLGFTAPEIMSGRWREVAFVLNSHMRDSLAADVPWAVQVRDIFNGTAGVGVGSPGGGRKEGRA